MTIYTVRNAATHEFLFTAYLRELSMILNLREGAVARIEKLTEEEEAVELHFNGRPSCFGFNVKSVLVSAVEGGR